MAILRTAQAAPMRRVSSAQTPPATPPPAAVEGRNRQEERAWEALDLDLRVVQHDGQGQGTSSPLGKPRHLSWRPQVQPQARLLNFAALFDQDYRVTPRRPADVASQLQPQAQRRRSASLQDWPHQPQVLDFTPANEHYVLQQGGLVGANSILSLCTLQTRGLVLYAVAKTYRFADLRGDGHHLLPTPTAERDRVEREIGYSLVPGQILREDSYWQVHGRLASDKWPPRPPRPVPYGELFRDASAAAPFRLLRQVPASKSTWHALYPLQEGDMAQLVRHTCTAAGVGRPASAVREMLGHAVLSGPLRDLHRMHCVGVYHQDIKLENMLLTGRFLPELPPQQAYRVRAYLVDMGISTLNPDGSTAIGTLATHPPEAFTSYATWQQLNQPRRPGDPRIRAGAFDRERDDIYGLGMALLRVLVPHLPCPLLPAYFADPRRKDANRQLLGGLDREKVDANHATAQAFLAAWRPVHQKWLRYAQARDVLPRPSGHRLPTPHGHLVDRVLAEVADLRFDFLSLVLQMLDPEPSERPRAEALAAEYRRAIDEAMQAPAYGKVVTFGRAQLRRALGEMKQPGAEKRETPGHLGPPRLTFNQQAFASQQRHTLRLPNPVRRHLPADSSLLTSADVDAAPGWSLTLLPLAGADAAGNSRRRVRSAQEQPLSAHWATVPPKRSRAQPRPRTAPGPAQAAAAPILLPVSIAGARAPGDGPTTSELARSDATASTLPSSPGVATPECSPPQRAQQVGEQRLLLPLTLDTLAPLQLTAMDQLMAWFETDGKGGPETHEETREETGEKAFAAATTADVIADAPADASSTLQHQRPIALTPPPSDAAWWPLGSDFQRR